jgi:tRNA A37 methylthiotransferase MiaB
MNQCSFCSIPRAKGRTKSVPLEIVVERVQDAIRRGKRSVALSCDELASYGQDLGTNIAALLDALSALPEQFGLTLRNVHPEWLIRYWQDLKPIFARGKIRYMVVPVQSGCDRILALMKRNHTAAEYQALVREIREISPETVLRTHILLGFPGETEDDFAETCRFVKDLPVDSVFATVYSERSFTPSAELPGKVPAHIARARALKIRALTRANILKGWRWHPFHFGVRAR